MDTLLALLAVLLFASWVAVRTTVRAERAVRRRLTATRERWAVTARAYVGGPAGDVARLRVEMARSLTGARKALAAAQAVRAPVGDVPGLLARLELSAQGVDGELRMLEAQPDRARIAARVEGPRSRALAVMDAAASLVDGLLDAAGHGATDLSLLQAECALEAQALRAARQRAVNG